MLEYIAVTVYKILKRGEKRTFKLQRRRTFRIRYFLLYHTTTNGAGFLHVCDVMHHGACSSFIFKERICVCVCLYCMSRRAFGSLRRPKSLRKRTYLVPITQVTYTDTARDWYVMHIALPLPRRCSCEHNISHFTISDRH